MVLNKKNYKLIGLAAAVCGFLLLFVCFFFFLFGGSFEGNWIIKKGDDKVEAGEHLYVMSRMLVSAKGMLKQDSAFAGNTPENIENQFVEGEVNMGKDKGKPILPFVEDRTNELLMNFLFMSRKFDELGLSLPDNVRESIKVKAREGYKSLDSQFALSKVGVGLKSVEAFLERMEKAKMVREALFLKEGGEKYVSDEAADEYTRNRALRFKVIRIEKGLENKVRNVPNGEDDEEKQSGKNPVLEKEGVETSQALVEKYINQIKSGKTIEEVNASFMKSSSNIDDAKLDEQVIYTVNEEDMEEEDEEEAAEYLKLVKLIQECPQGGGAELKEGENAYLIVQRLSSSDAAFVEKNRKQAREKSIGEQYKKYSDDGVKEMNAEVNDKLLKQYSARKQLKVMISQNASAIIDPPIPQGGGAYSSGY